MIAKKASVGLRLLVWEQKEVVQTPLDCWLWALSGRDCMCVYVSVSTCVCVYIGWFIECFSGKMKVPSVHVRVSKVHCVQQETKTNVTRRILQMTTFSTITISQKFKCQNQIFRKPFCMISEQKPNSFWQKQIQKFKDLREMFYKKSNIIIIIISLMA